MKILNLLLSENRREGLKMQIQMRLSSMAKIQIRQLQHKGLRTVLREEALAELRKDLVVREPILPPQMAVILRFIIVRVIQERIREPKP